MIIVPIWLLVRSNVHIQVPIGQGCGDDGKVPMMLSEAAAAGQIQMGLCNISID